MYLMYVDMSVNGKVNTLMLHFSFSTNPTFLTEICLIGYLIILTKEDKCHYESAFNIFLMQ